MRFWYTCGYRGRSSPVECLLAKEKAVGSIPIARSPLMTQVKRSWDILTEAQRKTAIEQLIRYFSSERNETIGVIAAENMLDMFLEQIGMMLYNKGVDDTKEFVKKSLEEVGVDIEVHLKK